MKTSSELAESRLDGPAGHKRRATQLKRVAGGIRTELACAATTGLSAAEIKKLTEAAAVLDDLAGKYRSAEKLAKNREDKFERTRKQVHSLMAPTFGALTSIEDRVALIAAVQSYQLRRSLITDLRDLDFYAKDALDSVTHTLSRQAETRAAPEVVAEAWGTNSERRVNAWYASFNHASTGFPSPIVKASDGGIAYFGNSTEVAKPKTTTLASEVAENDNGAC